MALKKELGALYNMLISTAQRLPPKAQIRTNRDIEALFGDYTRIENEILLQNLKQQAENKLLLMEMSLPEKEPQKVTEIAGIRKSHFKDNKMHAGGSEEKFFPEYSNWYGGNVDPQDLRRHKDLLDRQHFSGPFWEGRPKNPSIIDEENPVYERVEPQAHPPEELRKEKEEAFDTVKR